jgi:Zn-dependent M28 family amino/carboxypeptidase
MDLVTRLHECLCQQRVNKLPNKILDPQLKLIVNSVSTKNIKSWINDLSSFPTRHSKSKYINHAARYLKREFIRIGYNDVTYHRYSSQIDGNEYNLKNVICYKKGTNREIILICAHYDSRMEVSKDAVSIAPGANDNATGVAAILEISRILQSLKLNYDIIFALFSGEEQDLLGSSHYAKFVAKNKMNVYRLINLDMIGSPFLNRGRITVELDNNSKRKHNKLKENDRESMKFGKVMKDASRYADLRVHLDSIYDSDFEPFEANGIVVIGAYDGSAEPGNPHYHSVTDTVDFINWPFLASVTKMVLATVVSVAKK